MAARVAYISAEELASLMNNLRGEGISWPCKALTIIDVRDDDRAGGHIRGSIHIPSVSFEKHIDNIIAEHGTCDKLIFHCMQSQIRGPRCASLLCSRLDKDIHVNTVYVLRDGFMGWGYRYKDNTDLTEDFDDSY